MLIAIDIIVYIIGIVIAYVLLRKQTIKEMTKLYSPEQYFWNVGDRIFIMCLSLFSWFSVAGYGLIRFAEWTTERKPLKWPKANW